MADNKNELDARRWFRWRLAQLGTQYPELKEPEHQQRLTEVLEKEGTPCHANPPEDHADGREEADSSVSRPA
jgi:hypothetical protein